MITYSSQLTSVSYAGCVGAHFVLHQLTTSIDKQHKQIRDKRHDAASGHTKKSVFKLWEFPHAWTCWEELLPGGHMCTGKKYEVCHASSICHVACNPHVIVSIWPNDWRCFKVPGLLSGQGGNISVSFVFIDFCVHSPGVRIWWLWNT